MKSAIVLAAVLMVAGCTNTLDEAQTTTDTAAPRQDVPPDPEAPQAEPQPPGAAAEPAADPKPVPITKREARLVDKQKAMQENPQLKEVENRINASDPLTAVAQSYFTIGSRAQVAAMQHNLRIQKEIDGQWPTFEQFQQMLKQSNVKLSALYPYQMYAYDQSTGGIVILEDPEEKRQHYERAGLPVPQN
jgi:hypothetical protein